MPRLFPTVLSAVLIAACSGSAVQDGVEPASVVLWRNADVRGESIPAVGGTAAYHLEQETHILSAVRKSDGSLIWRRTLPVTNPNADGYGLALSSGLLVVGDLDLFGVDTLTGDIRWRFQPAAGKNPGYDRFTVSNGIVYCGSTSGHVYAVDAATGAQVWATFVDSDANIYGPVVVDGVVYAGVTRFPTPAPARGGAVAVDASTGAIVWTTYVTPPPSNAQTQNTDGIVVFGDRVFIGTTLGIHVADRATGVISTLIGQDFFGDAPLAAHAPYLIGGKLLVTSSYPASVTGVDPVSLARLWKVSAARAVVSLGGDATLAYVPQQGALMALDPATGKIAWTFRSRSVGSPDEEFLAAPAVDAGVVYLPGSKSIYALKRE